MSAPWTIQRVVTWTAKDLAARGIEPARLEAEVLVAFALGLKRIDLYLRHDQPMTDAELTKVRGLIERRRKREPVAYIVGEKEFYGRAFAVDRRVLVPRPETEEVVQAALELLPPGRAVRVLDVGTGSGAIAVTMAAERPDATVDAVDVSPAAADVARANAERWHVNDRVNVVVGDLFGPVRSARYDVVVSNPPYIPTGDIPALMPDVASFEPRLALDGGADGATVLGPIVLGAREHLVPGGALVMEFGSGQGERVRELARAAGYADVSIGRDLARIERFLVART